MFVHNLFALALFVFPIVMFCQSQVGQWACNWPLYPGGFFRLICFFSFVHWLYCPRWCGQRVPSLDVQMSTSTWDTFPFKVSYANPTLKIYDDYWVSKSGGIPAVLPLHQPCCLQLCHRWQSYWRIHVFWGFPFSFSQFHLLSKLTGHCLLRLPLLYFLCRLPLPGRLSLNERIVFGWALHALK